MDKSIDAPILELVQDGHRVGLSVLAGKVFFEIDGRMFATANELRQLGEGIFTFEEMRELFLERKKLECQGSYGLG